MSEERQCTGEEVEVLYHCQACGKEFRACELKVFLNPIEVDSDDYYPRQCPLEMDVVSFRRISPPRNRTPITSERHIYRCTACGWEGAKLVNGACPECGENV